LGAGCAHAPRASPEAPSTAERPTPKKRVHRAHPKHHAWLAQGVASFYGPGLWGNKTASGKRLHKGDFGAASRTLPFGTCLDVLNLDNGRRVQVQVNDRGPYVDNRVIDVTQAAARALGMLEKGLARVRLYLCGKAPVDARADQR
jgi:rare lipoprotein A